MSRRSSRRTATSFSRHISQDSNSETDDMDETFFQLMHFMNSRKRTHKRNCKCANKKTNKKSSAKKSPAATKKSTPDIIELDDTHENIFSKTIRDSYQKDVEHRVDAFFKSANLLSEDEEDDKSLSSKPDIGKKTVVSKDLYVLSDSDDDLPSTSVTTIKTSSYSNNTTTIEESKTNKEDELMEIVDNILDSSDIPVETNSEVDNWNDFKSKTDEILGSVTAILGTMNDKKEPSTSLEKEKQISSIKNKRSCPICLEDLDGNIVIGSTICGHIFCMECIKEAVTKTKSCPTCRKKINLKQIHRLYL